MAKLEYRCYDSAGLAVCNGDREIEIVKAKGRLKVWEEKTDNGLVVPSYCGIGQTRWATHGESSRVLLLSVTVESNKIMNGKDKKRRNNNAKI